MIRAYVPQYKVIATVVELVDGYARVHFYKDGMEWDIQIPVTEIYIENEEEQL